MPQKRPKGDDVPKKLYTWVTGSNNQTRAVYTIYEYPNGDVCIQLEDKKGGAEMWTDWDTLRVKFNEILAIAAVRRYGQ